MSSHGRLHHGSAGVVHHSKRRTRLRVPKQYRQHGAMAPLKDALEHVSGVQSVDVNNKTGSILIEHTARPEILEGISQAIEAAAPGLLMALLMPETDILTECATSFSTAIGEWTKRSAAATTEGAGNIDASDKVKTYLPLAFIAAGSIRLLQERSLLSNVAPIALFYYAFDCYWKLRQEERTKILETTVETQTL